MSSRRVRAGLIATFLLAAAVLQAPLTGMPTASADDGSTRTAVEAAAVTVPGAPTIGLPKPANRAAVAFWTAPTDDGGSKINNYVVRVYRGDALVKAMAAKATATRVTVHGLKNGVTYTINVSARNAAGASIPSALSAPVTPVGPPAAPKVGATTRADHAAVVRWAAPPSNVLAPTTGYVVRVYRGAKLVKSVNANASARRLTVTGLTNGVTYTLTVSAKNAMGVGAASARSAKVTPAKVRTATPKPAPKPAPAAYYKNCDAVRAAGKAPIREGQPGYSRKLDRDGDGVGCEW